MADAPLYQLAFCALKQTDEAGRPVPVNIRLRRLLKFALRVTGFRVVEMGTMKPKEESNP